MFFLCFCHTQPYVLKLKISAHANGVLHPGSLHARPSAEPSINMSTNKLTAGVVNLKHLPPPLRSRIRSFGTFRPKWT
jgi:hypothetical protein